MKALFSLAAVSGLMLATPAFAEDYNWTGAYAGAHVGAAWGNASTTDDMKDWCSAGDKACIAKYIGPFGYGTGGAFGGGTLGYNYQIGAIVLGAEADLGYMDLSGSMETPSSQSGNHQNLSTDGGLYGDITGRVGLSFGKFLVYGKGGFAFYDGGSSQATTAKGYETNSTSTYTGWTAGGGVEYAWTQNISLKLEYQHFDFGTEDGNQTSISDPPVGHVYGNHTSLDADSIKVGVAYHF